MLSKQQTQEINSLLQIKQWQEPEARKVLAIWAQSQNSLLGFCREFNIGYQRLSRWRKILSQSAENFDFVQISIAQQQDLDCSMEITFQNGRGIRIGSGFDSQVLQRLIPIIEEG